MIPFALDVQMPSAEVYIRIIPLILLFVLFYFILVSPQKKREKKDKALRDSIIVGERICTIGGIIGKVISVTDDQIVIESSGTRLKLYKWAVRARIEEEIKD